MRRLDTCRKSMSRNLNIYVLDESGLYATECNRKVASGSIVSGTIRFLVNARDLQIMSARI